MAEATAASTIPRFVPPGVDRDKLPQPVQAAFELIVDPAHFELVLCVTDALVRAAGMSIVFLLFIEILEQFELGELITSSLVGEAKDPEARDKAFAKYLRLVRAKEKAMDSWIRARKLSIQMWTIPEGRHTA